jgi:acyl-coenzyme A synthetase/AMP-(fatty) acid ligase
MFTTRKEFHGDRVISCYAQRPRNVNAMMAVVFSSSPDKLALVDGESRMCYRELEQAVSALASGLSARGVRRGDRVAVMLPNQSEAAISVLAIAHLGAVLVPLGTRLKKPEISYIFEDAAPVAVIHAPAFAAEMPAHGPAALMRLECGGAAWRTMLAQRSGAPLPAVEVDEHAPFGILYTSGTTGKPKGAVLTHLNVVHSCMHWQDAHQLTHDERTLVCVP